MRVATSFLLLAAIAAVGCGSTVVAGTGGGSSTGTGTGGDTGGGSPCPAVDPIGGASAVSCLGVPPGFRCTYGESVRPECRREWICNNGFWSTTGNLCIEPPPDACNLAEPTSNSMCGDNEGAVCTYGPDICVCTSCAGGPCMQNAAWFCAKAPTGNCPPIVPNDGTVCDQPGAVCSYGLFCSATGTQAKCMNGLWKWDNDVACPL
ncbi:MAG: hypothetical protein QM820_51290 [Minicystis sp.]